jgi:VanZ family protein
MPLESFGRRFWADLLMDKAVTFALLSALVQRTGKRLPSWTASAGAAWSVCMVFAVLLEGGKVFFQGRSPHVDNLLLAAGGAFAGVTLVPWLIQSAPVRRHPRLALCALALAFLTYAELTPFAFALAPSVIAAKISRIEWLPLAAYYRAEPQLALFDLWNKLLLSGFLGFTVSAMGRGKGRSTFVAGLLAGAFLEGVQVLTVTRTPSVTDVLILGAGAYLGGMAYAQYQTLAEEPKGRTAERIYGTVDSITQRTQ